MPAADRTAIAAYIAEAQRALLAGRYNLDGGYTGVAVGRAYYAVREAESRLSRKARLRMNALWQLPIAERRAVDALRSKLCGQRELGVIDLILFGSQARGDATEDSDLDIAVLVEQETGPVRDAIWTLGSRLSLDYDVLFNLYVIGQERWQFMKENGYPLAQNIEREGIALTPERVIHE